jgi:hypothetical protein
MRAEFSAVRDEIRDGDEETRRQMLDLHGQLIDGHDQLKRHMHTLHEDLVGKIALLKEGQPGNGKNGGKRSRKGR